MLAYATVSEIQPGNKALCQHKELIVTFLVKLRTSLRVV